MFSDYPAILILLLPMALVLVLTPLVRRGALRLGLVSVPRADRWHRQPTTRVGGGAMFVGVGVSSLLILPQVSRGWIVLGSSTFLFLVGLADDVRNLKPYQKLIGQIMGASLVVLGGLTLPWTS